ncbi:Kinase-like protein [Mycena sanguinolenta]|uniref:Kinase-like protein n=1 Tax=Mycena sanguinolenta TaxID=230812 RepID=A0A8H6YCX8_9AGAR|nr:Kinase-like protein [Mycena sanguinolenta]
MRLQKGIVAEEKREIYGPCSTSRRKDVFDYVSKGHELFSQWINQTRVQWITNENEVWVNLLGLGVRKDRSRLLGKQSNWIEDLLRCAQEWQSDEASSDAVETPEALDKAKQKVATCLQKLAALPSISEDLRGRLNRTAAAIGREHVTINIKSTKVPFKRKDGVGRIAKAFDLFSQWADWSDFQWAVGEYIVWSEMHRIGSTVNNRWTGMDRSNAWAEEVIEFIEHWTGTQELNLTQRHEIAFTLRRLSHQEVMTAKMSSRLVSVAVMLGDSPDLPPELVINPTKLADTSSSLPPLDANADAEAIPRPRYAGGSSDVRFGYYKFRGRREPVAIKEFRFSKPYGELKPRFSLEAFTWAYLSKGDNSFVVKFFGADIGENNLRLISRWQTHVNIVHFLNLETNKNQNFRFQKICSVAHAISWLHSKNMVHADIKGSNVLVDAKGVPRLADFGISRLVHDTIDEVGTKPEVGVRNPENRSTLNAMKPWDSKSPQLNTDSVCATNTSSARTRFVGSINWMAPERFRDSPEPTKASDVYAFAYLVLEIFANKVPFSEVNDRHVMEVMHINCSKRASSATRPEDLEDLLLEACSIPRSLWDIVVGCMRFDPNSRPTATAVHTDMKKL